MSFSFNSDPRKKKTKKNSQTRRGGKTAKRATTVDFNDDGLESFGLFNSTPHDADSNNSNRGTSFFRPAPVRKIDKSKVPSMGDVIAKLSAKDRARNNNSVPHVTPVSKSVQSSKELKRKSHISNSRLKSTSRTDSKRKRQIDSQRGIHAFFVKASELKASEIETKEVQKPPIKKKANTIGDQAEQNKKMLELSIFSSSVPTQQLHCPKNQAIIPDSDTKSQVSRITISKAPEETSAENPTESQSQNAGNKNDIRRDLNRQVFSGRKVSRNILAQLNQRSTFNTRHDNYFDSGYHGMRNKVHGKWQPSKTVKLDLGLFNSEVTCMEFDSEGVLLAVADSVGYISIFDFDEVNAADMTLKRQSMSHLHREKKNIPPFIRFRMGTDIHRISSINWNPLDENMLAVSFFNKDEVRVYDVSTTSENGPLFIRLADRSSRSLNNIGNRTLKYLPSKVGHNHHRLLIGGSDGSLSLWKFSHISSVSTGKQGRLVWSMNPLKNARNGGITEIVHLSANPGDEKSGLILATTSIGWFALIDINNCSRKSFSSDLTPQVMKTWSLSQLGGIRKHVMPSSKWMGVEKVYVWADKPKTLIGNQPVKKCVTLGVITSGGWIISLRFDVAKDVIPIARVLHRSPTVLKCDSTRTNFYNDSTPSVPDFASVHGKLDSAASLLVVTKTNTMYQVLPDSDKRVLDQSIASSGLINSNSKEKGGLTLISRRGGDPITIPIEGKLKHLAIHPDNEWMAASILVPHESQTTSTIQLMSLRSRIVAGKRKTTKTGQWRNASS